MLPRSQPSTAAFSTIELLVVVAIIALLLGLLVPVVGRMREMSLSTRCVSQLRTAGIAFHRYIGDMNQKIVTRRGGARGRSNDLWGAELSSRGYLMESARPDGHRSQTGKDPALLRCPAGPPLPGLYTLENWAWFTYGLNLFTPGSKSLTEDGTPLSVRSVASIERPASFILLADGVSSSGQESFRMSSGYGGLALRHQGKGNALYLDGHISPLSRQDGIAAGIPDIYP